jgi:hypothetical protein
VAHLPLEPVCSIITLTVCKHISAKRAAKFAVSSTVYLAAIQSRATLQRTCEPMKGRKKPGSDGSAAAAAGDSQPNGGTEQLTAEKAHLFNLLRAGSKRARSSPEQSEAPPLEKKTKAEAMSPSRHHAGEPLPDRQPDTWPETVRPSGAPALHDGNPGLCPVSPCATEVDTLLADGAVKGSQLMMPATYTPKLGQDLSPSQPTTPLA